MIFDLLAAALLNTRDVRVLPRTATPAAEVRESLFTRLNGSITTLGTTSLVVNGTTVYILPKTILIRRFGAKTSLTEFTVGDEVQVLGKWTDTTKTAVNARLIRDLSIQKRHGTFVGTIQSLSATGFVVVPISRPLQTVTVSSTTKYVDRKNAPLSFSSLVTGQKVMVRGMWDTKANTITEVTFVRDYSLPVAAPKTATTGGQLNSR